MDFILHCLLEIYDAVGNFFSDTTKNDFGHACSEVQS